MVKKIFIILLTLSQTWALSTLEHAQNIVANPSQDEKLKLLFADKNLVDYRGYVKWDELINTLKINALFSPTLDQSAQLKIRFKSQNTGALFFKILNDALNEAGFVYFTPSFVDIKDEGIEYEILVETRYILDPSVFYAILKNNAVFINNITKTSELSYEYDLDFSYAKLKEKVYIPLNKSVKLQRPLADYLVELKGASMIELRADSRDSWFAKLLFLDDKLKLVSAFKQNQKNNLLSLSVPSNAKYVLIGDLFSLDNIKRGLEIYLLE